MQTAIDRFIWARTTILVALGGGVATSAPWLNRPALDPYQVPNDVALILYRLDGGQTAATANALFWRIEISRPGDPIAAPLYTIEQAGISQLLMPPIVIPAGYLCRLLVVNGSAAAAGLSTTWSALGLLVPLSVAAKWNESLPPFAPSLADYAE